MAKKTDQNRLMRDALLFVADNIYSLIDNDDLPANYKGDITRSRAFLRALGSIQTQLQEQAKGLRG